MNVNVFYSEGVNPKTTIKNFLINWKITKRIAAVSTSIPDIAFLESDENKQRKSI